MKMHDLAERFEVATATPRKGKPEPYYPTVTLEANLGQQVGKPLKFHGEGVIDRHSQEKTRDGVKHRTTIKMKKLGVAGGGPSKATTHVCPDCGHPGGAGYCPHCGAKRMEKRRK